MQLRRLTALPETLLAAGYSEPPVYRILRDRAIDKRFPAQQVNGVWHFDPDHTPEIAAGLGLQLTAGVVVGTEAEARVAA
jgi:hypothetical protein